MAAFVVAAIGTPWALFMLYYAFTSLGTYIDSWVVFSLLCAPGLVVYAGLLRKAARKPVFLDPYGVWLGTIAVNSFWLFLLSDKPPAAKAANPPDFYSFVVYGSILLSLLFGLVGLTEAALRSRLQGSVN